MLLIPEDIYQQAIEQPNDGTPIGHVRKRMRQIEQNKTSGDDVRAAKFHQEFKRMNKLTREEEERPVDVRLRNLEEITNALPPPQTPQAPPTAQKSVKKIVRRSVRRVPIPRKKAKRASTGGGEDEEEWQDASAPSPLKLRSASTSDAAAAGPSKIYSMTKYGVTEYIKRNAAKFGITPEGHVLKADGVTPYKTSKIDDVVAHLLNRDKKSQFRNQPTGYKEFISRAQEDPFLKQHLFTEQQFGGRKVHKKMPNSPKFSFKPVLW